MADRTASAGTERPNAVPSRHQRRKPRCTGRLAGPPLHWPMPAWPPHTTPRRRSCCQSSHETSQRGPSTTRSRSTTRTPSG